LILFATLIHSSLYTKKASKKKKPFLI